MSFDRENLITLHTELLNKASAYLTPAQKALGAKVEIRFNPRLRVAIGRAFFRENRVELNPLLLTRYPHELVPTLAHELAHLWAPLVFGRQGVGHQIGWKKMMGILGFAPERTHQLPVPRHVHRVVAVAVCGCPGFYHSIKPRLHRKMKFGRRRYLCLKCRHPLELKP